MGRSGRFDSLKENFSYVYREEGAVAAARRLKVHASRLKGRFNRSEPRDSSSDIADVLFINGCDFIVPHPIRYRVDHQAEQLEMVGMSTLKVNAWELTLDHVRQARVFVIFRCPYADIIGEFIEAAHAMGKKVLFDIDDLVIDTKYTDMIPFVAAMPADQKAGYDDGVVRMGKTMRLCDGVITTTSELANQLSQYLDVVHVNRNVASEEMQYLSARAVYERDRLPLLSRGEVKDDEAHRWKVARARREARTGFALGYFSGSITHNADFEMVLPAVVRFMSDYEDVTLHVVGELDLPEALKPFENRVVRLPFLSWRRLPQQLSFVDVNLVPLADTIFNRAKSENKWVEAALVKVPSVASAVGALEESIHDGVTGLLCNDADEWYEALVRLKHDQKLYKAIALAAYNECTAHNVTCGTGMDLADFLAAQMKPCVGMVLPSLNISGGVMVALKHMVILRNAGFDVYLISNNIKKDGRWVEVDGIRLPVISRDAADMRVHFDKLIATMWTTLPFVKFYQNCKDRYYLVQSLETGFYGPGDPQRPDACRTYGLNDEVVYCTISPWCKQWLEDDYHKVVRYAPNGIDAARFSPVERDWNGKIRILVEGDSSSEYKNVDESFDIINKLDPERYEVWYLSYKGEPRQGWRVDKFIHKVPHEEVAAIYRQCHILLKTSILESFSYPPLEMMATGGQAVVLANDGNAAYLVDGENCLLFNQGEDDKAAQLIESIVDDETLRAHLAEGGRRTAERLDWDALVEPIVDLYR